MILSLYPLMLPPLTSSMLTLSLYVSSMRNLVNIVMTLEPTLPFSVARSCQRRLVQSLPKLNPLPARNDPPVVHAVTTVVVVVTFLGIAHHQSKRVIRLILRPRTMILFLNLPIQLTDTFFYYHLYSCPLISIQRVCWKSENCHSRTL